MKKPFKGEIVALVMLVAALLIVAGVGFFFGNFFGTTVGIAFVFFSLYLIGDFFAAKHLYESREFLEKLENENDEEEEIDESWELKEVAPKIFLLTCGNAYDLAMRFVRLQEFYESSNPEFRGKVFNLIDFMDWYSKEQGLVFTYPEDWTGFNIPGWVMHEVLESNQIKDWNKYDQFMLSILQDIRTKISPDEPNQFYLIGVIKGDEATLDHELAHGFYSCNPEYKAEMDALIQKWSKYREIIGVQLEEMGYGINVHDDEMQAYFSTGLIEEQLETLKENKLSHKEICEEFSTVFSKWKEKMAKA